MPPDPGAARAGWNRPVRGPEEIPRPEPPFETFTCLESPRIVSAR